MPGDPDRRLHGCRTTPFSTAQFMLGDPCVQAAWVHTQVVAVARPGQHGAQGSNPSSCRRVALTPLCTAPPSRCALSRQGLHICSCHTLRCMCWKGLQPHARASATACTLCVGSDPLLAPRVNSSEPHITARGQSLPQWWPASKPARPFLCGAPPPAAGPIMQRRRLRRKSWRLGPYACPHNAAQQRLWPRLLARRWLRLRLPAAASGMVQRPPREGRVQSRSWPGSRRQGGVQATRLLRAGGKRMRKGDLPPQWPRQG